jgi:hypothetical protein
MRIAISGTHSTGKSTLIDGFVRHHPDYIHEPEPYTVLVEDYGEEFSASPGVDDFYRQLEFNAQQLRQYSKGDKIICERSPADFLAYILALKDLKRETPDQDLLESVLMLVSEALSHLDLIVLLPLDEGNEVTEDEDPRLQEVVDERLMATLADDEFGLISSSGVKFVMARGATTNRLRIIEDEVSGSERATSVD